MAVVEGVGETAIFFTVPDGPAMKTTARHLVEQFYYEVWNNADEAIAREILHPDFQFRASLGPERHGLDGFLDYMRSIHTATGEI